MRCVEITIPLQLNEVEERRLAYHSFANVVNVLYAELQLLAEFLKRPGCFSGIMAECKTLLDSYAAPEVFAPEVTTLETLRSRIEYETRQQALDAADEQPELQDAVHEVLRHIRDVLRIMDVRVRELLARNGVAGAPRRFLAEEIHHGLREVLDAIARNSRGHFGIVFQSVEQGEQDYLVSIDVQGRENNELVIPEALIDSFRDLTANARKYSKPGSRIHARLHDESDGILLQVLDEGRGIPEDEIEKVVGYGLRGSNTRSHETKGGGLGLTKAYYICKQYGGRMWIESGIEDGTQITLRIPRQEAAE